MSDIEDLEIIDRVLSGDIEAFAEIIKNYQNKVYRYVYSKVFNYDEALDITQEIFMMTMEALKSFRKESKFSTWLFSIMVNYCKNYKKKTSRYSYVALRRTQGSEEFELSIPDDRQNPEQDVIDNDSLRIIKEELFKLPDDYKDILVLRDIEGLSYNEVVRILGINLSNVKVRIHRGRELLKKRLNERGLI
jgi:RNA polymerase sigma-70 factor, ECF subfamily